MAFIVGNVCISIGLNIQKYAHNKIARLHLVEPRLHSTTDVHETTPLLETGIYPDRQYLIEQTLNTTFVSTSYVVSEISDGSTLDSTNETLSNDNGNPNPNQLDSSTEILENVLMNAPDASYIRDKIWWAGMGVMLLGELGNFAAYGFASAVLIAPLGTVALVNISNIFID